jgi:hypothetical protein
MRDVSAHSSPSATIRCPRSTTCASSTTARRWRPVCGAGTTSWSCCRTGCGGSGSVPTSSTASVTSDSLSRYRGSPPRAGSGSPIGHPPSCARSSMSCEGMRHRCQRRSSKPHRPFCTATGSSATSGQVTQVLNRWWRRRAGTRAPYDSTDSRGEPCPRLHTHRLPGLTVPMQVWPR